MRHKQKELLAILIDYRGEFVTSNFLAFELSLSDRTVRSYIKQLKELLLEKGAQIIAKPGYGYQLEILNRSEFDLFLGEIHLNHQKDPMMIEEVEDRKKYMLNLLILEGKPLYVDELIDTLYISDSQLNKDLFEIKKMLSAYELVLNKQKQKITVQGKERAKRHFIMSYFFNNEYFNFLKPFHFEDEIGDEISLDMLTIIILDECREVSLKVSDFIIQNLVLHLALSIKRVKLGCPIKSLELHQAIDQTLEYRVARKIMKRTETITQVAFPAKELNYFTLHLMAKSTHKSIKHMSHVAKEVRDVLVQMQKDTGYPFASDRQLYNGLVEHIKPMLVRLERDIQQPNPLLKEIQSSYAEAFHFTKHYLAQLPLFQSYIISEAEWAYLTLHILAAVEKYKDNQKIKAMIICTTGYGSAQLLKNRVEKEFGDRIMIRYIKGYYEIDEASLSSVDCIVSSIDLSMLVLKIPVFHVSIFLSPADVQKIRMFLDIQRESVITPSLIHSKSNVYEKSTIEGLMAGYFILQEQPTTKKMIIEELLKKMQKNESADYQEKMQQQMQKREILGSVVFSEQVVVLHPMHPVGCIAKVGLAIIPQGVYWGDESPCAKFIFLISPSVYENFGVRELTKRIIEFIDDEAIQHQMMKVTNFQTFKELFEIIKIPERG